MTKDVHRITLHTSDVEYIVEFCRAHRDDSRSLALLSRVSALHGKIKDGVAIPAYIATKLSVSESLGFDVPLDKKAHRKQLYERWVNDPSSVGAAEINLVDAYRYENDLMTPEEIHAHDMKSLGMSQ